ncbi:MAG: 3',5'-cyclic-nucleotide phosphodiesterase [Oligoflexia bacterium]|nr:3',5'-cyclic-nucleotide phosphodiesterase [Oligoflexia bacterium]
MKVTILGCHGGVAPGYRTSCYMINDRFLIDAGSVASALSPKRQAEIEDIFVTHPHIDHIKDICFLVENTFYEERSILNIRSTPDILNSIQSHLLNDILWPDFSKIYVDAKQKKALVRYLPIEQGMVHDGIKITHMRVNHPGHAIGFILDDGKNQIVFSGDTGPTDELWELANQCKNLKAVFTEISFPNYMDTLARASGHFTTQQLLEDIKKLRNQDVPIYIAHFKPRFFEELMDEFHRHAPKRMHLLHQEDEFKF